MGRYTWQILKGTQLCFIFIQRMIHRVVRKKPVTSAIPTVLCRSEASLFWASVLIV